MTSASNYELAGAVCVGFGFFPLARSTGLPDGAAAGISFLLQIIAFVIAVVVLVRIDGNALCNVTEESVSS